MLRRLSLFLRGSLVPLTAAAADDDAAGLALLAHPLNSSWKFSSATAT